MGRASPATVESIQMARNIPSHRRGDAEDCNSDQLTQQIESSSDPAVTGSLESTRESDGEAFLALKNDLPRRLGQDFSEKIDFASFNDC